MKTRIFLLLCLSVPFLLGEGCTTSSHKNTVTSPPAPVASSSKGDIANVLSGDFAKHFARAEGRDPEPKDPEYVLAESLDGLSINATHPQGTSLEDAIVIPGYLDLWKRQKVETHWIQLHYPKHRMVMHSILMKRKEGKWYDVVSATDRLGGELLHFFFDVSESFGEETKE